MDVTTHKLPLPYDPHPFLSLLARTGKKGRERTAWLVVSLLSV